MNISFTQDKRSTHSKVRNEAQVNGKKEFLITLTSILKPKRYKLIAMFYVLCSYRVPSFLETRFHERSHGELRRNNRGKKNNKDKEVLGKGVKGGEPPRPPGSLPNIPSEIGI